MGRGRGFDRAYESLGPFSGEAAENGHRPAPANPADPNNALRLVGGDGEEPRRFRPTDLGNAERFVAQHGEDVRYCFSWNRWLEYDGTRWRVDDRGAIMRRGKDTARSIFGEAEAARSDEEANRLGKWAITSQSEPRVRAMLELAKSDLPVTPDELDADAHLLNVLNGTLDLRAGELREHRREDLITKLAPVEYDPNAAAPTWEAFLERVLPSQELRRFVQRAAGYTATADTSEQCMFISHGVGANGKSTFQEALAEAFGDYAMRTPTDMLMAKRAGGIPNDVARLKGARFVAASETEEGRRLAESLVKDLTGQDTISARFMRAEWFDFKPTHKLWLSTNHKPEIRGTDNAIWRRIRLIPWSVAIPPAEQDRKLPERLRAELAGILAWAVRGCLEWQREGLRAPDEVRRATRAYRAEMDVLAAFLEDCCVVGPDVWAKFADLYTAYAEWCKDSGEHAEKKRAFGARLAERGFPPDKGTGNVSIRTGVALRTDHDPRDPGPPEGRSEAPEGNSARESYSTSDAQNTCKTVESSRGSYSSYPETAMSAKKTPHEGLYETQGNLDNSGNSAGDMPPEVADYLADPPGWLVKEARRARQDPGRFRKPLCSTIAYEVYGYSGRGAEIEAWVVDWIAGGGVV